MNLKEKTKIFEESCKRLLNAEVTEMSKNIDFDIEKQIKDELEEYKQKEEFAYNKKVEKIEKDYNKQIYAMEMENKKEVLEQKKQLQKDFYKEIIQRLVDYTNSSEYETFIIRKIDEVIQKVNDVNNSVLSLTRKDKEKFGNKIQNEYGIQIEIMDDKYVGGCILEDKIQGLYLDNTIQNSINENLEIN